MLTDRRAKRFALSMIAILIWTVVVCGDEASSTQMRLFDLAGRQVEPLQASNAKAIVFLFVRTDCPISNRYAPEVRRLLEEFTPMGVKFWLVYPDSSEPVADIRQHIKEYAYGLRALRDSQHNLVKLTGVQVTPEVAVFVPGRNGARMVYRGRIDDRIIAFGKTRSAPTTRDLKLTLEDIVKGKQVITKTTPAIGCFIPELR